MQEASVQISREKTGCSTKVLSYLVNYIKKWIILSYHIYTQNESLIVKCKIFRRKYEEYIYTLRLTKKSALFPLPKILHLLPANESPCTSTVLIKQTFQVLGSRLLCLLSSYLSYKEPFTYFLIPYFASTKQSHFIFQPHPIKNIG